MSEAKDQEAFLDKLSSFYDLASNIDREEHAIFQRARLKEHQYLDPVLIGRGGMKLIYRVFDKKMQRPLAYAKLKEDATKANHQSFLLEAALTAQLEHPNIIRVFDFGIENELPYFTMELKTGESFQKLLGEQKRSALSLKQNLNIFLRTCEAIAYAHSKRIVHLDLKPENIQIGPFGEVVVCDWGLGKKLQDHEQPSWSQQIDTPNAEVEINPSLYGEIKGTPGFMAPEQIKKGGAKTEQTDIYALGCLLHLILIGRLPHRGDVPDLMHKTVHKEISLPPKLDLSDGLKSILMKCLNKEPELRYDAVITLKKDLEQSVGGYSTSAQNATLITEIKLFAKRNRFIIRVVMGFILMVSLGLLFFNHRLQRSQAKTQSAEKQARSAEEQAQSLTAVIMEKKEWRITETIAKSKLYSHDQFFRNPKKNIYKALKVLKGSLHIEHNLHFAHECMAELHFLCQNFSKARVHYEKSEHPPSSILKLCRRFAKLPKKSSELLSFEHFNELILQLSHNEWNHFLIERMIAYDQQQRPQGQHYLEAVKATFLSMVFGEITDFDFDREHKHLKIEGSGVKSLLSSNKEASGLSILRFLNPLSLDLSQTRFHSIPELKGFEQLRELNIRNTAVKEVSALNRFHILKVHINEGQLDKEQKQGLGGWIELIEEL